MKGHAVVKKIIVLLICAGIILLTAGCEGDEQNNISNDSQKIALSEYIESIKLPKNLFVTFDPSTVPEIASAKAYNITWLKLEPKKTAKYLLRYNVLDTYIYAEGPGFKAGNGKWTEYLNIYDGSVKGGLAYSLVNDENDLLTKLSYVINPSPGLPDGVAQTLGYANKMDYSVKKNLTFSTYEEAVSETGKVLTACGFPTLAMQEVYSLDVETMKAHYQLYINTRGKDEVKDQIQWSKDDECYLIHFRQIVDDIPLINVLWENGIQRDWEPTETQVSVFYSKDGIINIQARGLYELGQEIREGPLISPTDALQIVLDDYKKAIQTSETKIFSMELNYVGIYHEKELQLVPAWVFCISHPIKLEETNEVINEYTYFVINAFTGKQIRTAVDNG
jgi:hypothetical protein